MEEGGYSGLEKPIKTKARTAHISELPNLLCTVRALPKARTAHKTKGYGDAPENEKKLKHLCRTSSNPCPGEKKGSFVKKA